MWITSKNTSVPCASKRRRKEKNCILRQRIEQALMRFHYFVVHFILYTSRFQLRQGIIS